MSQVKCLRKIDELVTLQGAQKKQARHAKEEDLSVIKSGAMIFQGDQILWTGKDKSLTTNLLKKITNSKSVKEFNFKGKTVMPAFTECHTHLIFAGDRKDEFEMRMQGASYQEIAQAGGGILSTVRETRNASKRKLVELGQKRVDAFVKQGVACVEVKSGYGLDEKTELKMLRAARDLSGPKIVTSFLGAHAFPKEMSKEEYKELLLEKLIPRVAHEKLADRLDIFIEQGYFEPEFAKMYFQRGAEFNIPVCAHVEQLNHSGGAQLAIEQKALSIEHAVEMNDSDIKALANCETTAVLLPAADFYLQTPYPKAREIIDSGGRVALATDYNPGSSPTQDLSLIGTLARTHMKMSLAEVIVAYTLGAAHALGLNAERGSLVERKQCDFMALDGSWKDLFYSCGVHPVEQTWSRGKKLKI